MESWNQTMKTGTNKNCGSFAWQKFLNTACYYDMKQRLEDTSHSEDCHSYPTRRKRTHGYRSAWKTLSRKCFSCPTKCSNISYIFHIHNQSETKIMWKWWVWGSLCVHARESDSPPVSWGEWIGGAPDSNVHSVSQTRHVILPSFHTHQWLF